MREFEKFMLIDEKHIYLHFYSGCSFSDSVNPVKFFFLVMKTYMKTCL